MTTKVFIDGEAGTTGPFSAGSVGKGSSIEGEVRGWSCVAGGWRSAGTTRVGAGRDGLGAGCSIVG